VEVLKYGHLESVPSCRYHRNVSAMVMKLPRVVSPMEIAVAVNKFSTTVG